MPLSKSRNAARMRNNRALAKGVQPSATQLVEVLSKNQRKERLAKLISTPIPPDKVNAAHVISAIDIYNKMDHLYEGSVIRDVNVVFVIGKGYRDFPRLEEGSNNGT